MMFYNVFAYGIVRICGGITSSPNMFTESIVAGSVCFTFVEILAQVAVYSIYQVPLVTSAVGDKGADFAVLRITQRAQSLVKRTGLTKSLTKCSTWSEYWSNCQFLLFDVSPDFGGHFFRHVREF